MQTNKQFFLCLMPDLIHFKTKRCATIVSIDFFLYSRQDCYGNIGLYPKSLNPKQVHYVVGKPTSYLRGFCRARQEGSRWDSGFGGSDWSWAWLRPLENL